MTASNLLGTQVPDERRDNDHCFTELSLFLHKTIESTTNPTVHCCLCLPCTSWLPPKTPWEAVGDSHLENENADHLFELLLSADCQGPEIEISYEGKTLRSRIGGLTLPMSAALVSESGFGNLMYFEVSLNA